MISPVDPRNPHNVAPTGHDLARGGGTTVGVGALFLLLAVISALSGGALFSLFLIVVGLPMVIVGCVNFTRGKADS